MMTLVHTDAKGFHEVPHQGFFVKITGKNTAQVLRGRHKGEVIKTTTISQANKLADRLNEHPDLAT